MSRLQGEGIFSHYLEDVRAARLNIKPSKNRNYSSCFVWGFIFFALNSWLTFTGVKLGCCCRGGGTKKLRAAPPYQALLASWPERGWGTERQVIFFFFNPMYSKQLDVDAGKEEGSSAASGPIKSRLVQLVPQGASCSHVSELESGSPASCSSCPTAWLSPIRQEKCVDMKGAVCNFQQLLTSSLCSQDGWI